MPETQVNFESESYVGEALTQAEEGLLKAQLFSVLAYGNSFLQALLADNYDRIKGGAEVCKAQLGAPFTGLSAADSEFGMQLTRPGHVLRSTAATETPVNNWSIAFASGLSNWIGFNTSNGTAINIDKRAVVVPLAIWFTQGTMPTLEELYWQINARFYPIFVIRHSWVSDNLNRIRAARLRPMLWPGKSTVYGQVYALSAQTMEAVLVGITFGKGDFLRLTTYTAVQT